MPTETNTSRDGWEALWEGAYEPWIAENKDIGWGVAEICFSAGFRAGYLAALAPTVPPSVSGGGDEAAPADIRKDAETWLHTPVAEKDFAKDILVAADIIRRLLALR